MKFKKPENGDAPQRSKQVAQQGVRIDIKVPNMKNQEEAMNATLNNIHALTVLQLKIFGRLGFLIKKTEELVALVEKQ